MRGRVVKRTYSPGGVVIDAPVCNARVHICEVDRLPWIILRIPDPDIFRLRDDLLERLRTPFPWPPVPNPDPSPWRTMPADIRSAIDVRQLEVRKLVGGSRLDEVALNPQPLPPLETPLAAQRALTRELPQALHASLSSGAASVVRCGLLDHLDLIRP